MEEKRKPEPRNLSMKRSSKMDPEIDHEDDYYLLEARNQILEHDSRIVNRYTFWQDYKPRTWTPLETP